MLRSSDIIVLAALCLRSNDWTQVEIARQLALSQSSVNRSLKQLRASGLWRGQGGGVNRTGATEFFVHGLKYVFPAELGAPTRGLPTAHSGPGFAEEFPSTETYVWPYEVGDTYGTAVTPIHACVPAAAAFDPRMHDLMSTLDVLRAGRARERRVAEDRLAKLLSTHE
jgi:DNA-binding Lrp family transcriptional regulator